MRFLFFYLILLLFVFSGCDQGKSKSSAATESKTTEQNLPKIVAFGNSLTAGHGLPASESYPALLQKLLDADGYKYEVVNAGVSGDTTAGGVRRLDWSLEGNNVKFVILELGGNDILRGQPVPLLEKNLAEMIERAQSHGARVILAGMEAPSNWGPEYRREVHQAYQNLSKRYDVIFIPFFLKDVAGAENLIQEDGTHPNEKGTRLIAQTVYQSLKPLLKNNP